MIRITAILLIAVGVLSGCGILDSVNNTLNYTETATAYVQDVQEFAERAPLLAEQAVMDSEAATRFVDELKAMKEQILNFNALEAPAFAQDIHQKLLEYNAIFMEQINAILEQANLDQINWQAIQNSQMLQTAREIAEVLLLLQQLGG